MSFKPSPAIRQSLSPDESATISTGTTEAGSPATITNEGKSGCAESAAPQNPARWSPKATARRVIALKLLAKDIALKATRGGANGPVRERVWGRLGLRLSGSAPLGERLGRALHPHAGQPVQPGALDLPADVGLGAA